MHNLDFKNVTYLAKEFVGKMQTTVNIRISVKREIAEVLSVGTDSAIVSYESTNGAVAFYGKTNIKFLYNDGVGVVSSNYNADFTADIASDLLTTESKLIFDVITVDTKVDTSANTAMLTVLLEISVYAYTSKSVNLLVGGDQIYTKKQQIELLTHANVYNFPFVVDEELQTTLPIDTVLLAESGVCVTDYRVESDTLSVFGNATVRLTYTSGGKIVTDTLPFEFQREIDTAQSSLAKLLLTASVRSTKVRLDISAEGENTTLTVDINCNLQVESITQSQEEIVLDAYAGDCDYNFTKQQITSTIGGESSVSGQSFVTTLPKDDQSVLQTAVNVGAIVTKCTASTGFVTVDGIVCATAIYTEGASETLEIPFSQRVEVNGAQPQQNCIAKAVVQNFVLTDNGNTFDANVTLCLTVQTSTDVTYYVITLAESVPFDKKQLPAMEICLAHKGESLWELAKTLHVATEDILTINENLSDPLTTDARIVVFNKI